MQVHANIEARTTTTRGVRSGGQSQPRHAERALCAVATPRGAGITAGAAINERDARALVGDIARRFVGRGVDREDLEQMGQIGLLEATRRADPDRPQAFTSLATFCIEKAIREGSRAPAARCVSPAGGWRSSTGFSAPPWPPSWNSAGQPRQASSPVAPG